MSKAKEAWDRMDPKAQRIVRSWLKQNEGKKATEIFASEIETTVKLVKELRKRKNQCSDRT